MRKFLLIVVLLLLTSDIASWLRMFNPLLALQSWSALIGQPIKLWVGSILFYPLLELVPSWPAYLLGGSLYFALTKYWDKLTQVQATLLGTAIGFSIYSLYAYLFGEWVLRKTLLVAEQLVIYTLAGAFFGFCYYHIIIKTLTSSTSQEGVKIN